MASDNDPNSLIISIVSLVISSLWPVIWAIHVRYRDKIQARQLRLSEVTTRYVKDGIQDAGYEVGDYLIALEDNHPRRLWEVLTTGRTSKFAPAEQASDEASLAYFKNNLLEVYSLVRKIAGFWDDVTKLCEDKDLPCDFWGGKPGSGNRVWLYRANNHRKFQEVFEIANYYRLGLDRKGKEPYSMSRPTRFWIIQKQWVAWGVACEEYNKRVEKDSETRASQSHSRRFWITEEQWARWGVPSMLYKRLTKKVEEPVDDPECTSTLQGWAKELRCKREESPRELPHELTSNPREKVSLKQLKDELDLKNEKAPKPQERAQELPV